MKDFQSRLNLTFYRITILLMTLIMLSGLLVVYFRTSHIQIGFVIHFLLILILTVTLWVYPKKESNITKFILVIVAMTYFYTLFFLYPETTSTFLLLYLSPGIALLFTSPLLFYFSLISNLLLMTFVFSYLYFVDHGAAYPHVYADISGNIINFLGSQVILFLIFYLSLSRIKKQQLYYDQIKQAERLKTAGQMAAAVAHEIRNPITVVKGFLQFYQEDPELSKQKKEHFQLMLDELNVAETVITDFLSIARSKADTGLSVIQIKEALQSVVDLLISFAHINNIKLKLEAVDDDCYIIINPMEFKQLMINLLKNTIEASPYGETLMIKVKKQKNNVEINVIDFGVGMSAQELKTIGTPFYSLKNKGTGLGLMICFNIVENYGGTINFKSEKGRGTTVTIQLPRKSMIERN